MEKEKEIERMEGCKLLFVELVDGYSQPQTPPLFFKSKRSQPPPYWYSGFEVLLGT